MSLAGIPPLSGFFAKLTLLQGGLETERYAIVAAALLVSLMTLFSMTKIWSEAFWKPAPEGAVTEACGNPAAMSERFSLFGPIILLATVSVGIGLMAGPVMEVSLATSRQLLDTDAYIQAVFPDDRPAEGQSLAERRTASPVPGTDVAPISVRTPAAEQSGRSLRGGTVE